MSKPDRIDIIGATDADLDAVAALARVIWHRHYPGMITPEQIDYMLARSYAHATLKRFITESGAGLDLARADGRLVGFCAYHPAEDADELKLDKLYVLQDFHGRGVGRRLIEGAAAAAQAQHRATLILNVNKNNAQAISVYLRNGFVMRESVVIDIGGGFVMDDFIMAKRLDS
jgi:diamine N-acetyltransferase